MSEQNQYDDIVTEVANKFRAVLSEFSALCHVSPEMLFKSVSITLQDTTLDGRALDWRVRLFLFDSDSVAKEPIADSDYPMDFNKPGETTVHGLQRMVSWVAELASAYHGAPCAGLDTATLSRKLRGLRVQICNRRAGTGTLVAPYKVHDRNTGAMRNMLARCDVIRADAVTPLDPHTEASLAKLTARMGPDTQS